MSRLSAGGLTGQILPRQAVDAATLREMLALKQRCFLNIDPEQFFADLAEKEQVILIHDDAGMLQGFSTIRVYRECIGEQAVRVFFSGDTVIVPEHWGTPVMQRCWLTAAMAAQRSEDTPLYWLLLCSGFRTYRYLPLFFRRFWPCVDEPTPPEVQALLDGLASRRYGERYRDGVVAIPGGQLVADIGAIPPHKRSNPAVRFFEERNPGHASGDELACITRIDPDNFSSAGRKLLAVISS
jgi:hypothetical protein